MNKTLVNVRRDHPVKPERKAAGSRLSLRRKPRRVCVYCLERRLCSPLNPQYQYLITHLIIVTIIAIIIIIILIIIYFILVH